MAFQISGEVPFADDIRRIAREQIDRAVSESRDRSTPDDERIHSIRKRCKKLRGLLRLVRPSLGDTYGRENAYFRDVARALAPLRDVHATLAAFDAVLAHSDGEVERARFAPLRQLIGREGRLADAASRFADVGGRMEAAGECVAAWPLHDATGPEAWRSGFERTYRQARRSLAAAYREPAAERFHDWRKRVKYHWYHLRLLSPLWERAVAARAEAANGLGELLGLHHDLAVLRETLVGPASADVGAGLAGSFVALVDRHRAHLEATARPLGMRLFAETPSRIGIRYERYWAAWSEELAARTATVRPAIRASA
jgi:CHAD domain-containing protein